VLSRQQEEVGEEALSAVKLHGEITINGKPYPKGSELPWYMIYPFFLVHMGVFGGSGFFMAYAGEDAVPTSFLFMHGGIAILVYTVFYLAIFGVDEVKWMFGNALIGLYGIWCEIGWFLSLFGKQLSDFPWYRHVVPFLYYVLYTFLLRHLVIDLFRAREDPVRRQRVETAYVVFSLLIYTVIYLTRRL
jgi:hypothetical protein